MDTMILFLLKSLLVSGIMFGWYCIGLRNKRLHNYNRFFLLFTLYASIQVPLLHFQWFTIKGLPAAAVTSASHIINVVSDFGATQLPVASAAVQQSIGWPGILLGAVALVSIGLVIAFLARVAWLVWTAAQYPGSKMNGIHVVRTDLESAPFSFLNFLFWKNSIPLESDNGQLIFGHEAVHIRQKHSIDILTSQLIARIFWFNPFYWLIQKELAMVHEFIADERSIKENDTDAFARMLLQAHDNGRYLSPAHRFFSSPIKRRLVMIQSSSVTKHATLRRLLVLPLVAGAVIIFSSGIGRPAKPAITRADKKIVLMLDAGHGGQDAGCHGGELMEKDLTLAMVKKITEMAPEYNIDIRLTRSSDNYITLRDRVAMSNQMRPDAFISIHFDNNPLVNKETDSFTVIISRDDHNLAPRSEKLAHSVIDQLVSVGGVQGVNSMGNFPKLHVLRANTVPAMLIEMGDIKSNKRLEQRADPAKLEVLCAAILRGVVASQKG